MKFRYVNTKIYGDPYIRKLKQEEKFLFVYFLTNHLTNICGMYEITEEQIVFDTGLELEEVSQIIKKLERDKRILYRENWICIINFIKNQSLNPSVITGIEREVKLVPDKIRKQFVAVCDSLRHDGVLALTAPARTSKKAFFDGNEMRYKRREKKWYVIVKGEWKEFAGKKEDIEWR